MSQQQMNNHHQNQHQNHQQDFQAQHLPTLAAAVAASPGYAQHSVSGSTSGGSSAMSTNNSAGVINSMQSAGAAGIALNQQQSQLFWQQIQASLNFMPTSHPFLPVVTNANSLNTMQSALNLGATDMNQLFMQAMGSQLQLSSQPQMEHTHMGSTSAQQQASQVQQQPSFIGLPGFSQVVATNGAPPLTANVNVSAASNHLGRKRKDKGDVDQQKSSRPSKLHHQVAPAAAAAAAPSVISSTSGESKSNNQNSIFDDPLPPKQLNDEELERLNPTERRRYERNLREQQRSYRISQQIKQLRDVLSESSIPFKPNKFSILVSVTDYIKELQSRAVMLDADHQRLIDTIRQTTELVTSGRVPTDTTGITTGTTTTPVSSEDSNGTGDGNSSNKDLSLSSATSVASECNPDLLLVQGIDYREVFNHCPYPLGVTSLDGRILACNPSFAKMMGCDQKTAMEQQSLFLFIRNHQEIFEAMAGLLKKSSLASETGERNIREPELLFWNGHVVSSRRQELAMSITLTGVADGNPKYFNFSISTAG